VQRATEERAIDYPVAVDNGYTDAVRDIPNMRYHGHVIRRTRLSQRTSAVLNDIETFEIRL